MVGNEATLVWDTKGRSVFSFLNSCLLYALVFSDGSGTTLHRTLRGSGEEVLEEIAFDGSEESEVDTFYIGGLATKRVCDVFGGKREKGRLCWLDWIDSPKGLGPDAGGKQKPIKECDSLGSGLNDE